MKRTKNSPVELVPKIEKGGGRMTDSQFLDRALNFIVEREEDNDYICEKLHEIPEEHNICADGCENINRSCILRFLKHYKDGKV